MNAVGETRAKNGLFGVEPSVAVVVSGVGLAMYLQGGYRGWAPLVVGLVLFSALFVLPTAPRFGRGDLPIVLGAAGLAGWAVVDGVLAGRAADGARYAALIVGALVLAGVCREFRDAARIQLVNGLLAICCVVAAFGWVGVLVHHQIWGFKSPGLWRASSTLTYPNATAAVLAMAGLVCLAVRARRGESRGLGVAATVLVTGLVATLSRAGLLGFGVGFVVLLLTIGRPVLRGGTTPLLGAAIATAGLLPSVTASTTTPVTVAVAVAAACIGLGVGSLPADKLLRLAPVLVVVGVVAAAFTPGLANFGSRFSLDSPDRWDSIRAAWQVFAANPVFGVGPGLERLEVDRTHGGVGVYRYAHNEYLQVSAELGVIGGVLLVALLVVIVRRLHRARRTAIGAGVLAAFAALIVHAGFDFIWHIPAIPLFAAALLGTTDRCE